jgi:cytochrome c-type biogenesis protein CcmE
MKKTHIIMLVIVAAGIASLTLFIKDLTTDTSFAIAKQKHKDKFVNIVAKLDTTKAIEWNPQIDPNFMSFYATDSLGMSTKVIYKKNKPYDFEKSDKLVLKGYMRDEYFECKDILLKCPSKYKDAEGAKIASAETRP